jgi:hypothetical protein
LINICKSLSSFALSVNKPLEKSTHSTAIFLLDINFLTPLLLPRTTMDAIRDTVNSALEKLNMGGAAPQGTPTKEPSEEELNELKSKYSKAGQEQVFVRIAQCCNCRIWMQKSPNYTAY